MGLFFCGGGHLVFLSILPLCLLVGAFSPFTFKVIIESVGPEVEEAEVRWHAVFSVLSAAFMLGHTALWCLSVPSC